VIDILITVWGYGSLFKPLKSVLFAATLTLTTAKLRQSFCAEVVVILPTPASRSHEEKQHHLAASFEKILEDPLSLIFLCNMG